MSVDCFKKEHQCILFSLHISTEFTFSTKRNDCSRSVINYSEPEVACSSLKLPANVQLYRANVWQSSFNFMSGFCSGVFPGDVVFGRKCTN